MTEPHPAEVSTCPTPPKQASGSHGVITAAHRADILNERANFETVAKAESDCSSAKRGGDLGFFKKGQMQSTPGRA